MTRRFRLAQPHDVPAVAALINRAYLVEAFFTHGDRTNETEIGQAITTGEIILAETAEGAIEGCVELSVTGEEGHFSMLSVDPAGQHTGLGAALVAEAERRLRESGCRRVTIEVASPRHELASWYARFGYEETGTAPWPTHKLHRLRQPAHFILLSRTLPPS